MTSINNMIALLVAFAVCGAKAQEAAQCSLRVDLEYSTDLSALPRPVCSTACSNDQGQVWYDGVAYKTFDNLRDAFGKMVRVSFKDGDVSSCQLVPYKTDAELEERESELQECLGNTKEVVRCSDGFTLIGNSCYLITPSIQKYNLGEEYCNQLSASTAIVDDEIEQANLAAVLPDTVYIALNDKEVEGTFVNPGRVGTPYLNWNDGEPSNTRNEDCTLMKDNKEWRWNDVRCSTIKHTLCESDSWVEQGNLPYTCPEGFFRFETSCYAVTPQASNYADGNALCGQYGGYAVYVNSRAEQAKLAEYLSESVGESVFMGLIESSDQPGIFVSANLGRPILTSWTADFPRGLGSCSVLDAQDGFNWSDASCSASYRTMCEVPASV